MVCRGQYHVWSRGSTDRKLVRSYTADGEHKGEGGGGRVYRGEGYDGSKRSRNAVLEHPKYTESNYIHCVVGGCKMPIYWAKHEYIQHCLYILSPTSCNGNTPITI